MLICRPSNIQEFAKSVRKLAKADKIGAFILAWYGEAKKPEITTLSEGKMKETRELVDRREQIVKTKMVEKNRLDRAVGKVRESVLAVDFSRKLPANF
ncbi:MAG: IS110 family transposase [Armatimonadetes bacterium]|nr:IS110 family transposase [Armatimonadota bacterium]